MLAMFVLAFLAWCYRQKALVYASRARLLLARPIVVWIAAVATVVISLDIA